MHYPIIIANFAASCCMMARLLIAPIARDHRHAWHCNPQDDVSHCPAARERDYSNNWRRGKEDTDYV